MVAAPVAAEEGVEEPLGVAGRQGVLGPEQQVEGFVRHYLVQLGPAVPAGHGLVHHDAQGGQLLLDHWQHDHKARALGVGHHPQRQRGPVLQARAARVLDPPSLVQEGLGRAPVPVGVGVRLEVRGVVREEAAGAPAAAQLLRERHAVDGRVHRPAHADVRERRGAAGVVPHHVVVTHLERPHGDVGLRPQGGELAHRQVEGQVDLARLEGSGQRLP
mmetsp:Transcript_84425/g.239343  ORF Transcript_84425/g.239343 Transcript_84425/m.239343 type:complete len:217 (+) Transcript_84425:931-1581(+)